MIPVVAVLKAKPGKEKVLEGLLKGLVEPTKREAGCLAYNLHRDVADPSVFIFVEQWASDKEMQAHLASAHVAVVVARKEELTLSIEIRSLQAL